MLFEDALYYPTIDIRNEAWLKSAALLWNHIFTIVPESEWSPYRNESSRELCQAGILLPHKVNPYNLNYPGLEDEVREYLNSREGKRCFKPPLGIRKNEEVDDYVARIMNSEKMWQQYGEFCISIDKFAHGLMDVVGDYVNNERYVITSRHFMHFYMTALANRICQNRRMALLTDLVYTSDLTDRMIRNTPNDRIGRDMMKQGLLYKFIIQGVKIDPKTSVDKIIRFREKYHYEMDEFRMQVSDLVGTQNIEGLEPDEAITQLARLYRMGVKPALHNIQKAMDGHKIKWAADGTTSIAIAGVSPMLTSGAAISSFVPVLQEGLKMVYKRFFCNSDNEEILMNKPFSFLYRINKYFGGTITHNHI